MRTYKQTKTVLHTIRRIRTCKPCKPLLSPLPITRTAVHSSSTQTALNLRSLTYTAPVRCEVSLHDCPVVDDRNTHAVHAAALLQRRVGGASQIVQNSYAFAVPQKDLPQSTSYRKVRFCSEKYYLYIGEIKNELFLRTRPEILLNFVNHLADSARRRLKRKLL